MLTGKGLDGGKCSLLCEIFVCYDSFYVTIFGRIRLKLKFMQLNDNEICIACRWTWTLFQDITFQAMIIIYRMVSRAKCILPNPLTKPLSLSSWTQHQFTGVGSDKTHVNCLQTQSINVTIQRNCEHHVKTNEKWRVLPWNINWQEWKDMEIFQQSVLPAESNL